MHMKRNTKCLPLDLFLQKSQKEVLMRNTPSEKCIYSAVWSSPLSSDLTYETPNAFTVEHKLKVIAEYLKNMKMAVEGFI